MKKLLIVLVLMINSVLANSDNIILEKMEPDFSDKPSLQRGLALYQNYCSGCHSMQFQRYGRVAKDLDIPEDLMLNNAVFNAEAKIGSLMYNAMNPEDAKEWFGVAPPDLTLETRVRGVDWVYTYLKSFYLDPKRPWGVNNKVFPNVAMPNVLAHLQGDQFDTCEGHEKEDAINSLNGEKLCGLMVDPRKKGEMTSIQFDQAIYDLVNFLSYSAEPIKAERERLGIYVLSFLIIFFIAAYFLKKEYWKDVK